MQPMFTLNRHRWYAMQVVLRNGTQHVSPVWIFEVRALKSGKGIMQLHFWHANYPEGVQDKVYDLRVIRREPGYLLAERQDDGSKALVLLSEVTSEWIGTHFRQAPDGDLQAWLDRQCAHP